MTDGEERLKGILEKIKVSGRLDSESLKDLPYLEKDLVQTLYNEGLIEESISLLSNLNTDKELQSIKKKLIDCKTSVIPLWKSVLKYAAIFIGVFASIYYLQLKEVPETKFQVAEDYIRLKMGDDRMQFINQNETQEIISASGEIIGRQEGSNIHYLADTRINELIFNELQIPNGKVFNLELSDGTIVNLNSGTKIRYPVKFLKGKKREVFIDGEAFFDVTKDKEHPFIVNTDDVAITVLGTKFNVSSYKEDSEITTVLVEGSVNITDMVDMEHNLVLKPGMKGSWNKSKKSINMDKVDTKLYTGWIRGELIFKNSIFSKMAKTLERKYNVSIENKNKYLAKKVLTANFNTNIESIEEVLKVISEIHPFNYIIKDKHILILAKNENL
ncbi:FecR family protein [Maribacter sp. ACAM166]|uniref:FecR family protein n=1 Tax=Maribacter sp. ACAM166 TaxID=2508996 RepID=UPI001484D36A|nr:FecR family protein [Maribacter sp. ACAM166]